MNLSKKFLIVLLISILFLVVLNLIGFIVFPTMFFSRYLEEKSQEHTAITLDYVNQLVEEQASNYLDMFLKDVEMEFFELLEANE